MKEYVKNLIIGLFVIVACLLTIGIILYLQPRVGDAKETLIVRFSNLNGITVGTRVLFAGKPVGEVVAISQIPQAREQPTDELGQVYFYQLILHVDSSVRVYNTDQITTQTSGLLGEKSIAILPKAAPKGVRPVLMTEKTPIYAESVDPLEHVMHELGQVSDKVEEALDKVIGWIDQNGYELGSAIRSIDNAFNEATTTLAEINQTQLVSEVKKGVQNFSTTMNTINTSLEQLNDSNTFTNLGATVLNAKNATHSIELITDHIAKGKGSVGEFIMNDTTYLQVNSLLSKLDTLMNDVNHYGVLFHLNKEWQRTRLRQATLLNALDTPASFENYFSKEVDLINTAMSRLSMLVDRAHTNPFCEGVIDNKIFQRDFAELLRQSKALYTNLKLYNEELMDAQKICE